MNKDRENFRAIVVASGISLALASGYAMFAKPYSEEVGNALSWSGLDAILPLDVTSYLFVAWLFLYAMAHLLSFFFVHYARWLLVAVLVLGIFMSVVSGLMVTSPVLGVLWSIHYTIQPFYIGMAFFSPDVVAAFRGDAVRVAAREPFSQAQKNTIIEP